MPPRYGFLTDRMRDYLEHPAEYDSQAGAEIAYHVRQSWEQVQRDVRLLEAARDHWMSETVPSTGPEGSDVTHGYAPMGAECGEVVELGEDGHQAEDARRYGTKADGGHCSLDAHRTARFTEEVALCTRHLDDWSPS